MSGEQPGSARVSESVAVGRVEARSRRCAGETAGCRDATLRLVVCAVLTLVSASTTTPVRAEDGATGWLDTITGFFAQPGDKRVTVPKRRKAARPTSGAPEGGEAVQAARAVAPSEDAEGREPTPPLPAESAVGVPDGDDAERSTRADAAALRAPAERPAVPVSGDVPAGPDGVQPIRVLRAVEELVAEIQGVRRASGIDDFPPEAELVDGRAPIHMLAKSLEVLGKVVDIQRRLDVPEGTVGAIPIRNVDAADVLSSIEQILLEMRKIRRRMGIDRPIAPEPSDSLDASPMIYKRLADASFMLDGLRGGPLNSDDVHAMALSVLDEMALVADRLGVALDLEPARITGTRYPLDVGVEVARAAYKVAGLQTRLRMDASGVPKPDLARVTPSTNYDATNMLLAEMTRIKLHLGIDAQREALRDQPTGTKPKHNTALIMLIVHNLERMTLAVPG